MRSSTDKHAAQPAKALLPEPTVALGWTLWRFEGANRGLGGGSAQSRAVDLAAGAALWDRNAQGERPVLLFLRVPGKREPLLVLPVLRTCGTCAERVRRRAISQASGELEQNSLFACRNPDLSQRECSPYCFRFFACVLHDFQPRYPFNVYHLCFLIMPVELAETVVLFFPSPCGGQDLRVGDSIDVWGRKARGGLLRRPCEEHVEGMSRYESYEVMLYDCDDFTQRFYQERVLEAVLSAQPGGNDASSGLHAS